MYNPILIGNGCRYRGMERLERFREAKFRGAENSPSNRSIPQYRNQIQIRTGLLVCELTMELTGRSSDCAQIH